MKKYFVQPELRSITFEGGIIAQSTEPKERELPIEFSSDKPAGLQWEVL